MHRRLASLVAPPRCAVCGALDGKGGAAEIVCAGCHTGLVDGPAPVMAPPRGVDRAFAAADYEGRARSLAHALKFSRRVGLAAIAAEAIAAACPGSEWSGTIVPVPPAALRRAWRGFDPAEEIALALAALLELPLARPLRRRGGRRQVGRSRRERLAEPPRVRARGAAPARVLLVDDVRTTGATLAACAAALRTAGAERVVALTFAASR